MPSNASARATGKLPEERKRWHRAQSSTTKVSGKVMRETPGRAREKRTPIHPYGADPSWMAPLSHDKGMPRSNQKRTTRLNVCALCAAEPQVVTTGSSTYSCSLAGAQVAPGVHADSWAIAWVRRATWVATLAYRRG